MKPTLKISDDLSLPMDAVTQTFADLGIRGSGKTNTGVVMMEEMMKASQQAVALDPTDAWYGIRSSSDGKGDGFKVIVMGGPHGDLPLEGSNGTIMAEFVVDSSASVIFSLRHLSISDQRRFAQDFAEKLYDLKGKPENRTPLHIFIDEADEFVPQRIPHGFERMFGAYDRLVRRGRSSGIGLTLISQRPQVLNKDVLSQCETLICHRLLHKLDRKAVEAWIEAHDTEGQGETFMAALASLERGMAWVWSPSWLDVFKQVPIRFRETFDSSFTPKAGQKPKTAAKLAEVDLEALKHRLAATIEKAKQDDPKELKARIRELERQAKAIPLPAPTSKVDPGRDHKIAERAAKAATKPLLKHLHVFKRWASKAGDSIIELSRQLAEIAGTELPSENTADLIDAVVQRGMELSRSNIQRVDPKPVVARTQQRTDGEKLRDGAERMLSALCQFSPGGMPDGRLRSHAGLKKSGTYSAYKSDLFRGGYIEKRGDDLFATQAGIDYFGGDIPEAPQSTEDVLAIWNPKLRDGARRMLDRLIAHRGKMVPRERLFEESNLEKSGTASAYLSDLKRAQLALVSRDGVAANTETLFL